MVGQSISGKSEQAIQSECVVWLWNNHPETRGLFCYNLGNSKNAIDGAKNKGMGLISGRSDTVLYWGAVAYMIEFKTDDGRQGKSQIDWQLLIEKQGFKYFVVRSLAEFQKLIVNILDGLL